MTNNIKIIKNNINQKSSKRVVFFNNKFVNEKDANISIYDSALMFGDMVFEMTRSFNKIQFKLDQHLDRLYQGIKIYRIPITLSKKELKKICLQTVERNEHLFDNNDEHRLMINISRGPLGIYSEVFDNKIEPTIIVSDFPLKWTISGMSKFYDEGVNCVITNQKAIPATYLDPKIKNRSRAFYQLANIEASQFKGENNWALLLDNDGFIAEGTGSNFFIVKENKVLTPKGKNCLVGISRNYIFEICDQLNIKCEEADIEPFHVYDSDEAFLTATPFCLLPVKSLNFLKIGEGKFGEISKKILNKWSENVGVNIEQQMRDYYSEFNKNKDAVTPYKFK